MAEHPNQVNGAPPHAGPSAAQVVGVLLRDPVRSIVLKWNYKSAITSSLVRGIVFLLANLTAGLEAALLASAAESLLRFCTAGFYGALTQAFGEIRPARHGTLAAVFGLPVVSHALEVTLHVMRDTPNLALSIAASLVLTMGSTVFTLFAMRRGLLVVGVGDAQTLGADLRAMPALAREFARAAAATVRRASSATAVLLVFLTVGASGRVVAADTDDRPVRLFLDRAEPVLDAYVGRRHIEVVNSRFNARGWMTVATTFDVVRRYARLNDIRLAVDTEAVSAVRVAGRSHLRVVYDYITVNGVEVAANRRAASWPPAPWQPQ